MAERTLEKRIASLERDFEQFKKRLRPLPKGWGETFGMFANDPDFDNIVRLGREYRQKLRPKRTRRK